MGSVQRREGRAQAHELQGRRDPVPRDEPGRHLARERQGLHSGQHRDAGDRRGRPRQVQRGRSAASAHRKNRRRHSLHRRARRGPERQQLAEGPGNAVSAHLHALYAAAGGCDGLRGAADADESGACEPDSGPRVCVPGDAHDNALPEPRQATGPVASRRSTSGISPPRRPSTRSGSPTPATSRSSSSAASISRR